MFDRFTNASRYLAATAGGVLALTGCALQPSPSQTTALTLPDASAAPFVAECEEFDEWDKPATPFRIYGNAYYVGTCGISSILIVDTDPSDGIGHVVIDSGTEKGADIVAANIATLGFAIGDVGWLLQSHEHFDHVGGLAKLQALSKAAVIASKSAGAVLRTGIAGTDDPQYGMHDPMTPVMVDTLTSDGDTFDFGALRFQAVATPGHTPGALTWQWESCAGADCRTIVYADSLSPISADGYRFGDHPDYVRQFRTGLAKLTALECDLLITPHPSSSQMLKRMQTPEGLIDRTACKTHAATIGERLDKRLLDERAVINGE